MSGQVTIEDVWAPFALVLRCGPLELRAVTDADIAEITDVVLAGIHDPDRMPFVFPWSTAPAADLPRNMGVYYWAKRAEFSPAAWTLDLTVRHQGRIVGVQGVSTLNYAVTRTGETGSWLGRDFQGRGIGTLMRQAICALLFDHLDAAEITSGAFTDNPASLAVSRKVGYVENGTNRVQRRPCELALSRRLLLTPENFVRPADPVEVTGVAPLRAAVGL